MRVCWVAMAVGVASVLLLACVVPAQGAEASPVDEAREILAATGVKGGLVVHLGCGTGELTAALRASESYLVHWLDADPARTAEARAFIRSRGLYGPVGKKSRWM